MDRGPYSHAIPTIELSAVGLDVTATVAGLAPIEVDWGVGAGNIDTVETNIGTAEYTYAATGVHTVTMTDTVGNTATASITLT